MAKSTFCRTCSEYFAITPATLGAAEPAKRGGAPAPVRPAPAKSWAASSAPERPATPTGHAATAAVTGGLRDKLGDLLGSKPRVRTANCFECSAWHELSSNAQSTTCKACGAYIDLQDYKIHGGFSRNIKTRGTLFLGPKGDLSSSKIVCEQATIHGKMRGNLSCAGRVTVRVQGRLYGSIDAGQLIVEKGSEVSFSREVHASSVEVHGAMSGQVVSDSHVTIFKSGSLDGSVTATCFTVEKGGVFQGELTISPRPSTVIENSTARAKHLSAPPNTTLELGLDGGMLSGEPGPAMG